jgi:hypothetical protein
VAVAALCAVPGAFAASAVPHPVPPSPESAAWCDTFTGGRSGGVVEGYTGLVPDLPVCGPSPTYSRLPDASQRVRLPEAWGKSLWRGDLVGFQCVELSERWLAMAYGLDVVSANGNQVAWRYYAVYHASHRGMRLVTNGTPGASPQPGDIISFSNHPTFQGDADGGHVAVVVAGGHVDPAGNGEIFVAQENLKGLSYTHQGLPVRGWVVGARGEGFRYAEWLRVAGAA